VSAGNGNADTTVAGTAAAQTAVASVSSFSDWFTGLWPSGTNVTIWLVLIVIALFLGAYILREVEG
jgi:hypothetical protein